MARFRELTQRDWVSNRIQIAVFVAVVVTGSVVVGKEHAAEFLVVTAALVIAWVCWQVRHTGYRCAGCGNEFEMSLVGSLVSPHTMTAKHLRCPSCGELGWAKVLRKISDGPSA